MHGDRDLRVVGRGERDVPGVRRGVLRVGAVLGGAGLGRDDQVGDAAGAGRLAAPTRSSCRAARRRRRSGSPGPSTPAWSRDSTDRSGLVVLAIRCGTIRSPRLAMVAVIQAIWNGVTATSRWPMPVCASAAVSGISPSREPTTSSPMSSSVAVDAERLGLLLDRHLRRGSSRPRRTRCCRRRPAPRSAVTSAPPPLAQVSPAKLDRVAPPVSGRVICGSPVTWVSGV